jgi:hypothetical protein
MNELMIKLVIETQPRKLEIKGVQLRHIVENTMYKTMGVWAHHQRI